LPKTWGCRDFAQVVAQTYASLLNADEKGMNT